MLLVAWGRSGATSFKWINVLLRVEMRYFFLSSLQQRTSVFSENSENRSPEQSCKWAVVRDLVFGMQPVLRGGFLASPSRSCSWRSLLPALVSDSPSPAVRWSCTPPDVPRRTAGGLLRRAFPSFISRICSSKCCSPSIPRSVAALLKQAQSLVLSVLPPLLVSSLLFSPGRAGEHLLVLSTSFSLALP